MTHELKIWTEFYQPVLEYKKRFEHRLNDRDFKVGDTLHLREWDREKEQYTGRNLKTEVLYVLSGGSAYSILSISEPKVQFNTEEGLLK